MATTDPYRPRPEARSPVDADRPAVSFVALIGAATLTVAALLTAVLVALGQQ